MQISVNELLTRLGAGGSIESVCQGAGITSDEFQSLWNSETASCIPTHSGTRVAPVKGTVRIERDDVGIPHVFADNDEDLFFGFGYATAQDRLFQLDYLRRRALGRLAEVLGPEACESDLTSRTVGLHLIAESEWNSLPEQARRLVAAYAAGVNALQLECAERLPIEFQLLGYCPEVWQPGDLLAIVGEFRWYLTGRFPVIVIPELAKRRLGTGALYDAFLLAEADDEAILPPGSYVPRSGANRLVGTTISDPAEGHGSNNWVVSAAKSQTGAPLVASDPHIAFGAVSCWHEIHLHGGSFNVAGTAYVGMPGILIGRNDDVAWGITNNICSLRDLYQERTSPDYPGCFLYDNHWEPARERAEVIQVKGADPVQKSIRLSRNGPIVDDILPLAARNTGPVSIKWQGEAYCGWVPALIDMNRARTADTFRHATEPWGVPTFCVVYADRVGNIGFQCTGQIPVRHVAERAYRPGWDPAHQWSGVIPFAEMPHVANPERGWIATANNRVAADDFPWPLSGTWNNGYRAVRLRQILDGQSRFSRDDFAKMQQDCVSLRAAHCVRRLLTILDDFRRDDSAAPDRAADSRHSLQLEQAANSLRVWNFEMHPDSTAASIFNVFFEQWSVRVASERFSDEERALVAGAIGGLASRLLEDNVAQWFVPSDSVETGDQRRLRAVVDTFVSTLQYLSEKLGPRVDDWKWGRLHVIEQKHVLSARGDLSRLLDRGGVPVRGDYVTVCNTGHGVDFSAPTGAGYRMIADLSDPSAGLWAVDAGGESGHVASRHYDDQLARWLSAKYHYVPLSADGKNPPREVLTLTPKNR